MEEKGENLKHYISRNLNPSINYEFEEFTDERKRVVVLTIPCARLVPTEFDKEIFIRIGFSKKALRKYPHIEAVLWEKLKKVQDSIVNRESLNQNLSFSKLLVYYSAKGLPLKEGTFKEELSFYVPGTRKSDNLYSVREFGNQCLLYTIDQVLDCCDVINVIQADESNRIVERKDVPLFDAKAFREAALNTFIHNDWLGLNAPMISVFSERIDILSYGTITEGQTLEGFFEGKSQPTMQGTLRYLLAVENQRKIGQGSKQNSFYLWQKGFLNRTGFYQGYNSLFEAC